MNQCKKLGLLMPALLTFALAGAALLPSEAAAQNCPGLGRARLDWRDNAGQVKLATSNWDVIVQNSACTNHNLVGAKVLLTNHTNTTQNPECWLSSAHSADWAQVTLPPNGKAVVHLEIGNGANVSSKLECRGNAYLAVSATWAKLQTNFVSQVVTYGTAN
jgi:hypothetical protein